MQHRCSPAEPWRSEAGFAETKATLLTRCSSISAVRLFSLLMRILSVRALCRAGAGLSSMTDRSVSILLALPNGGCRQRIAPAPRTCTWHPGKNKLTCPAGEDGSPRLGGPSCWEGIRNLSQMGLGAGGLEAAWRGRDNCSSTHPRPHNEAGSLVVEVRADAPNVVARHDPVDCFLVLPAACRAPGLIPTASCWNEQPAWTVQIPSRAMCAARQ